MIRMIEEIQTTNETAPRVWAIGGGKGGVGKSVITANLALAVARTGARVALVDADLGGANLHTMVGLPSPKLNLSDFIARRVGSLAEIMNPTPYDNLWLVSGARALLETANPNYGQKGKILRHIANLDVDHVFLDLGAGTALNVLDFFLVARKGILVVVPERLLFHQGGVLQKAQTRPSTGAGQGRHRGGDAGQQPPPGPNAPRSHGPGDGGRRRGRRSADGGSVDLQPVDHRQPYRALGAGEARHRDGLRLPRLLRHQPALSRDVSLRPPRPTLGG
jgi:hypothetical protein